MQSLPYLEATIRELLRLLPPVPFTPKRCIRDTVFPDGTFVPAGTDVGLAYLTTARLTSVWGPDAASFVPERFLDPETGKLLEKLPTKLTAFNPGPRVCVGRNLAMLELKTVVACLLGRFRVIEEPGQTIVTGTSITYSMKNPLMVSVQRIASN
ncbi:hypothetical protein BBJ28_00017397 [Nothophytophthora sp. Chile5]|nr:hypothetical protein BBJ28_00017397 [Nothophytophthora sp. Chile5]